MRKKLVIFFCLFWAGRTFAAFGNEALLTIVPSDFGAIATKNALSGKSDFENAISALSVDSSRLNACIQTALREWPVLPVNVKQILHPLFYPPMPPARYAKENYEIFFEPGNAEGIARLALVVDNATGILNEWLPPVAYSIRIILTPFPQSAILAGYTLPLQNNPTIVLNAKLPEDKMARELLYQLCFARLYSLTTQIQNSWLYSASSLFLYQKLDAENYVNRIEKPTTKTFSNSVFNYALAHPTDPSFLFYLDETFSNKNLFSAIWETASASPNAPLMILMDTAITEYTDYTTEELFPRFSLWTLSRGERNNGTVFRGGAMWHDVAFYENVKNLPAWISDKGDFFEPYGLQYVRLAEAQIADENGIRISFDGSISAKWAVGVATFCERNEEWLSINLDKGKGELIIPHKEGQEVIIAVGLIESYDGASPAYTLNAEEVSDYPVKISNAVLQVMKYPEVNLEWTSEHEGNVFGWRIWRTDGMGGRTLVTQVPIISPGYTDYAMHYMFIDRASAPGVYSYELQVITRDGLTKEFSLGSVQISRPTIPVQIRRNFLR